MADTKTRKITRDQLSQAVNGNPRLVRLLELLVSDVADVLPAAIDEVQLSTLFSLHGADGSKAAANHALMLASEVHALASACRRQASDISALRDQVDLLRMELHEARARLAGAVSRAQSDASAALTLTTGV